jgi:chemotaxis protein MotB
MSNASASVIVVRRKIKKHSGHHGGAWKVAYADFVTAMMALFIVLWLMSANEKTKKSIAAYFRDPIGNGKDIGSSAAGAGENLSLTRTDMDKLKEKIETAFRKLPQFKATIKDKVEMTVTTEGLRIEFLETEKGLFFESGSEKPTEACKELLAKLAEESSKLPNQLLLEGHTDSRPFTAKADYGNWELSADRANAARRLMVEAGVRESQISQVRGYADQRLRTPNDPLNAGNRRISVVILSGPADPVRKSS